MVEEKQRGKASRRNIFDELRRLEEERERKFLESKGFDSMEEYRAHRKKADRRLAMLSRLGLAGLAVAVVVGGGTCVHSIHTQYQQDKKEWGPLYEQSQQELCITVTNEESRLVTQHHPSKVLGSTFLGGPIRSPAFDTTITGYLITGVTDDGRELSVNIVDSENLKKESIDALVSEGTRVCFPQGNLTPKLNSYFNETYFDKNTSAGTKQAAGLRVLSE